MQAFNQILGDKEQYVARFEELLPMLADTSLLEKILEDAQNEYNRIIDRMRRYIEENSRQIQNQEEYADRYREMDEQYQAAEKRIQQLKYKILEQTARKEKIRRFLDELRTADNLITEFDESLWQSTVESVAVHQDKSLTFTFRDGSQIPVTPLEKQ